MARAGPSSSSPPLPPLPLTREAAMEEAEEEEEEEEPPPRALVPRSSPVPRPQQPTVPRGGSSSSDEEEEQQEHQHPCLARPLSQHPPGLPGLLSQHAVQDGQGLPSHNAQGQFFQHAAATAATTITMAEEPPQHAAGRHVLFADALGLPLAHWRRYQPWPATSPESPPEVVPALAVMPPPTCIPYLLPSFVLPPIGQGEEERLERLRQTKVELEEVLPPEAGEPHILRGTVRVLNVSYHKSVHVRASRDRWQSHRDYPALYIAGDSPDGGLTDRFAFRLDFGDEEDEDEGGARLDFVVRYQTDEGVYWANNHGRNYSVILKGLALSQSLPKKAGKEGDSRRLKSCMRPIKIRSGENELQVEDITHPFCIFEEGNSGRELTSKAPTTPVLQPPLPMTQIPEVTITANSPEKKEPSKDRLVDFTDSPHVLAFKVHPTSREELKVPLGLVLGTETLSLGQWEVPELSKCDLTTEGSFMEECMEEQLRRYQELPYQLEDAAIDRELEQLYLSHLSRLRAEELGGRGEWAEEEEEGTPTRPGSSLIDLRQSVLTDRDLIVNWTGPERALNSSLAEEITLHYAKQRGDDSRDSEEEGFTSGYATLAPREQVVQGRDSPPVLLEGHFLNHQEEGSIQQSPAEDSDSFVTLRVVSPNTLHCIAQDAVVMPLVVPARALVPLSKRPADLPSSTFDAQGQSKSQGFLIGQGSLWLGEGLHVHKPAETNLNSHSELEKILIRSLQFLSLFVFLPVVFSSCMPLVAVTLYLLLDWFS